MVKGTLVTVAFVLAVGVFLSSFQPHAYAVSCDAIVGEWAWFTGGNVTLTPDGTITSKEVGKVGTWECTNTTRGVFTLRWVFGTPPFVDTLTLSADGQSLSGKNQFQYPVTATRISTAKQVAPEDSQEIKRLVERLNKNYKDTILFQRAGEDVFADDIIIKTRSIGFEDEFTLVQRYSQCTIKSPSWRFPDDPLPTDYRMTARSIEDCDNNRYGLKWEEKTEQAPLRIVDKITSRFLDHGEDVIASGAKQSLQAKRLLCRFQLLAMTSPFISP